MILRTAKMYPEFNCVDRLSWSCVLEVESAHYSYKSWLLELDATRRNNFVAMSKIRTSGLEYSDTDLCIFYIHLRRWLWSQVKSACLYSCSLKRRYLKMATAWRWTTCEFWIRCSQIMELKKLMMITTTTTTITATGNTICINLNIMLHRQQCFSKLPKLMWTAVHSLLPSYIL